MQSVVVDKIASVALAAELGNEIRISQEIPCEEGVLIVSAGPNVLRFVPPLVITEEEIKQVVVRLEQALQSV